MDRIWLKSYPAGVPTDIDPDEYASLNDMFDEACAAYGHAPAYTNMGASLTFAQLDALSRAFAAWLQRKSGLAPGRPRRIDDAQHPAVPDRAVRGAAGRHGGGEYQSSVYRPRTRASAQGLRRQSDRHRREFRARAAAGVAAYRSQNGVGDPNRRSIGTAARDDREFRAAPRAQTDPGLEHARRVDLQGRALVGSRHQARTRRSSARKTSRFCNIPGARPASPRRRFSRIEIWWPTCCRPAPGSNRRCRRRRSGSSSPRCRSITSFRSRPTACCSCVSARTTS